MKKSGSSNVFVDGLIMDMNPMITPNSCLTDALNATIITMNGNENMLQQDMGNGRVETAYLPTGYVPVGTAELGGIIYIVSYNPLIDKCLIGSFPSPERNITSDEVSKCETIVTNGNFQIEVDDEADPDEEGYNPFPIIKSTLLRLNLLDENEIINKLMPGDKYKIYVENGGISGNTTVLSDVKDEGDTVPKYLSKTKDDEKHTVDDYPKYITIHVIAIDDDGRITYLDDTLKWMNTDYDYYIDELEKNKYADTKDIDSYRNLVSTAYNIFNSKVSGELALLFEVKTINSFSATWDALVEDNEVKDNEDDGNTKKATFKWYFNWESSDPKINPAYIILTKSENANTDPEITEFENYAYETQDEYKYRNNDGFDLDVTDEDDIYDSSSKNHISFNYSPEADNHIWDYTWTPSMKYGLMEWLAIDGQIDLSLLGTGIIYLDEWRYYIEENNFILSWGLSCYPEYNKEVKEVILDFIRIDKVLNNNFEIANIDSQGRRISDEDIYINKYLRYTISDKKSYSGNYSQSISFGETTKIKLPEDDDTYIEKNTLYLVAVCAVYGNNSVGWKYIYDYRWLYTTGQWNTIYLKSVVTDFGDLYLDDVLSFSTDIDATESINADTYNTTLTIPDTTTGSILGMKTYAIGYDLLNSIYADSSTVNVNISTSVKNYPELFSIEKLSDDTRTSTIGEKTVTRDPDNSVDALKSSENKDTVKSKTGDSTINQDEYLITIKNVLSNNITEEVNNSAVDWFFTSLDGKSTEYDSFSFNLYGAIFSRINGELSQEKRNPSQVIRPLLFYEDDFDTFNMYNYNNSEGEEVTPMVERVLTISLHNSSGNPIAFTFSRINVESSTEEYTRSTLKKEWNPGDTLSANTWYGSSNVSNMYTEIMNPELQTAAGRSPFCFVIYNLGAKHSDKGPGTDFYRFKNKNDNEQITYGVGLWVNANECFLPIYDYIMPLKGSGIYDWTIGKESEITHNMEIYKQYALKIMSQRLALFLMQLYYVDTSITTSVDVILVSNIFRLKNYYETWSLDINSELDVEDMNNSIFIKEGTNAYSLADIQDIIKDKSKNETNNNNDSLKFLNNISYSDGGKEKKLDGIGTYSHRFTINTDDIYNIYEEKMGMNDFAVIFLCDEQNCKVFDLYNSQYLYVYDSDSSSLLRANQNDGRGKYIHTYGSMTLLDSKSDEQRRFLLSTKGDAGESSALMLALKVNEGDLSFDIDKLYLEKILMYFKCTSGHVEITTNCGSKLPIK